MDPKKGRFSVREPLWRGSWQDPLAAGTLNFRDPPVRTPKWPFWTSKWPKITFTGELPRKGPKKPHTKRVLFWGSQKGRNYWHFDQRSQKRAKKEAKNDPFWASERPREQKHTRGPVNETSFRAPKSDKLTLFANIVSKAEAQTLGHYEQQPKVVKK